MNLLKTYSEKIKPQRAFESVQTTPLTEEQLQTITQTSISLHPPQLLVGSAQSVGKQRDHNEDTLFSLIATIADGRRDLPFGVFIVARWDGRTPTRRGCQHNGGPCDE